MIKSSDGPYVGETVIYRVCPLCDNMSHVVIPVVAYDKWLQGAKIQDAWPESTPGQRETLISGSHESCFDEAFAEDEDED